jgi:hypothetical protein
MPITANNTQITFNDGTVQTTSYFGAGAPRMFSYTSDGTYTKSPGVKAIKITAVGAGGPGRGVLANTIYAGGGGGGGAVIIIYPGQSITETMPIIVSASNTTFGGPSTGPAAAQTVQIIAYAGSGNTAPDTANNKSGGAGGYGCVPVANPFRSSALIMWGQAGTAGSPRGPGPFFPAGTRSNLGGMGGSSILGGGGAISLPGGNYGGGGGGANTISPNTSAGTGAPGIVIIEEFF